ncbi:MAG: hypothetical protein A3K20_00965 [Alphaproteobacteria bacterium GWA1_45_9]|nr:MAG: hypothetical protein A2065_04170 [Alphaproteobacteria bacterium GWB1_45_5]OFW76727.1 MAG: hypothetical protein A3K20_00965 [Alphaproteobacteria bacterium GWA1_45_9]HCI48941.1 hypothetical protein [Holosporales bacterium]
MKCIHFYIIVLFGLFLLSSAKGCDVFTQDYTCNYFTPCRWNKDKKVCEVGPRGFNYNANAYVLGTTFAPITNYDTPKTTE